MLLKSTTKSAQSLPPTKCIKRHEPKTLLEEMKSAEQSRRAKLSPNHTIPPWIKKSINTEVKIRPMESQAETKQTRDDQSQRA